MQPIINHINKAYFWDVDIININEEKSMRLIIERVMTLGNLFEISIVINRYGVANVKNTILNLNWLDNKNLRYFSLIFGLPIVKFKCYTQKQLKETHWDC